MSDPTALPGASYRRFDSLREYEDLIDELIPRARATIRIFDKTLSLRYNSALRTELLARFLKASRSTRLFIAVHDARHMERDCPRLLKLYVQHMHAVKIHETLSAAKPASDAFVIIDDLHYVHRFHQDQMRAAVGTQDSNGAQQLTDRFDEIWEASAPAKIGTGAGL